MLFRRAVVVLVCFILLITAVAAAPSAPRLLIIGDSVSLGLAASSEATTYRSLLTVTLGANTTRIGATTLANVPKVLPAADLIVLEVGLNDVLTSTPPISETLWPAAYGATLDRLQATGATVIAATPAHLLYRTHTRYDQMARYAGYIKDQAALRHIAVADLWAIDDCIPTCLSQPEDYTPFPPFYHGDNFHPNDLGHWRIFRIVMNAIRPPKSFLPMVTVR